MFGAKTGEGHKGRPRDGVTKKKSVLENEMNGGLLNIAPEGRARRGSAFGNL